MLHPNRLKTIRLATGLSQERFAHLIGASFASVNRWEQGHSSPTGTVLAVYQAFDRALRAKVDLKRLVAQADGQGTPYFLYRISKAAFEKGGVK